MKYVLCLVYVLLSGCVKPPTDKMIDSVAQTCQQRGMIVRVWVQPGGYRIHCETASRYGD